MMRTNLKHIFTFMLLVTGLAAVGLSGTASAAMKVDCNKNGTITNTLALATGSPITIDVSGTCNENVVVRASNVTLMTKDGATINGPDATKPTVSLLTDSVAINGFTITGGSVGISGVGAQRILIENCTVEKAAHSGIFLQESSGVTVDHCTIENNPGLGIAARQSSSVTVTNSTISANEVGIHVTNAASASIGINLNGQLAGNTITGNRGSGILINAGGAAVIAGNAITGNGITAGDTFGQAGVFVFDATALIVGGNTISGNGAFGLNLGGAHVHVGDAAFGLGSANSITGNNVAGINAFLGTTLLLENADVSNNTGPGLRRARRATAEALNSTVRGNSGDGIQLVRGAGLFLDNPVVTVTGDGGFGLNCADAESKFDGNIAGIGANTAGTISPTCTGF
jgi:parallel beta-helix repeat protein